MCPANHLEFGVDFVHGRQFAIDLGHRSRERDRVAVAGDDEVSFGPKVLQYLG